MSWNGLAISAFARASKILKGEAESTVFNFPVVGCDVRAFSLTSCLFLFFFVLEINIYVKMRLENVFFGFGEVLFWDVTVFGIFAY